VGTTYAWFTVSVTSGNNRIVSGNLSVVMNYYDADQSKWVTGTGEVFEGMDWQNWQPDASVIRAIEIKNDSSVPIIYNFKANILSEYGSINTEGESFYLSENLYSYQEKFDTKAEAQAVTATDVKAAYTAAKNAANATNNGMNGFAGFTLAGANDVIAAGESRYYVIALYMPDSGVEKSTTKTGMPAPRFDIKLDVVATQSGTSEDSFGAGTAGTLDDISIATKQYALDRTKLLHHIANSTEYIINDAADFNRFVSAVNNNTNNVDFTGDTVRLINDIDLGGADWALTHDFNGQFSGERTTENGTDKSISNFTVHVAADATTFVMFPGATNNTTHLTAKSVTVVREGVTDPQSIDSVSVTNGAISTPVA
ncbi:MAG: hypothetical protein IKZ81_05605, partial [Clostridia bacterium]|nr:hypothetical protein [Clostridia bacterium]